jgi:hypothetical protein
MAFTHLIPMGVLAAAICLPSAAGAQQDADAVRAKCLADAGADYSDGLSSEHQTGRKQRYITCMQQHGLPW